MLDFDDDAIDGSSAKETETLDNPATFFEIEPVPVASPKKIFSTSGGNDNSKTQRTKGDITNGNGSPAIRKPGGIRKRKGLRGDKKSY